MDTNSQHDAAADVIWWQLFLRMCVTEPTTRVFEYTCYTGAKQGNYIVHLHMKYVTVVSLFYLINVRSFLSVLDSQYHILRSQDI